MAEDTTTAIRPAIAEAMAVIGSADGDLVARCRQGGLDVELRFARQSLWVILRRSEAGGLALRMPVFGTDASFSVADEPGSLAVVDCRSGLGETRLVLTGDRFGLEQLRACLSFTAAREMAFEPPPRDLVAFGANGDPQGIEISVEAEQRKMNTGLVYFELKRPEFGKVLYLQNFTSLNDFFNATGAKPEAAVGRDGDSLGYRMPVNPESGEACLPTGKTFTLYDTMISIRAFPQHSETDSAWQFLDMVGGVYPWLSPPDTEHRDWPGRSRATVRDLMEAPEARVEHYGHLYFHPYTASEYPDVMVQLSLASALEEWGRWCGIRHPLVREIVAGLDRFHDRQLGTLRRYLPNVGTDKDADAVDSWYLYHPMLNLANLALAGDGTARNLFLATVDYGIRAARHFGYKWPILYNMRDFSVIRAVAEADQRGQTDVGGIYAWVMLQAYELTLDRRFLDEAVAAIDAAKGMRFDLNYQANLTAWGATACIRLWRITNRKQYLAQSYVYLASFFHNSQIWESDIGFSRHIHNFLAVTCLEDAPYMAAYECFDSFAAFERYLDYGGPDLIPSVKLLVGEYCRHALDRAWLYYPDALPPEMIAEEIRNGYIRPDLNFPLEDLYPDGQKADQVGQEIYGAGAAMVYATRAFRRIEGAPFVLFSDVFARAIHRVGDDSVSLRIDGPAGYEARLSLIGNDARLETIQPRLATPDGDRIAFRRCGDRLDAIVPADATLLLGWTRP